MDLIKKKSNKGFTLAELLIVMLIIAILVAFSIIIFYSLLEKSREALDLANARDAYAHIMIAAITDDEMAEFNGVPIKRVDGVFRAEIPVIAQKRAGWTMDVSDVAIGGVPSQEWIGEPSPKGSCIVEYSFDGYRERVTVSWHGGFNKLAALRVVVSGDDWWSDPNIKKEQAFERVQKIDSKRRKESDQEVLRAIAGYFHSMNSEMAAKILGARRFEELQKGHEVVLFRYGVDEKGSIRFSDFATRYQPYFADLGYNARLMSSSDKTKSVTSDNAFVTGTTKYDYADRYLFCADEMVGTEYKSGTFNNICLKCKVSGGKLTGVKIWVKDLEGEGFSSK